MSEKIIKLIISGAILVLSAFCFLVWYLDYAEVTKLLALLAGKEKKLEELQIIFFPPSTFERVRTILLPITVPCVMAGVYAWIKAKPIAEFITANYSILAASVRSQLRQLQNLPVSVKITVALLLAVFTGLELYNSITFPVTYDEAFSYFYFFSKSPVLTISHYSLPNNHILYSVITHFFTYLPFPPNVNMKLPALLFGLLTLLLWILFIKSSLGTKYILPALMLLAFSNPFFFYASQARGYILLILFALMAFAAIQKIVDNGSRAGWRLFILANILGMFTIPSFLYVSVTMFLVLAIGLYKATGVTMWRKYLVAGVVSVSGTLLLYLPLLIISGLHSLTSNEFSRSIELAAVLKEMVPHLRETLVFLTGTTFGPMLFAALAAMLIYFVLCGDEQNKKYAQAILLICLLPPVFMLVHSVIPFPRTWSYLVPFLVLVPLLAVRSLEVKLPAIIPVVQNIVLPLLAVAMLFASYHKYREKLVLPENAKKISQYLLQNQFSKIHCQSHYHEDMLRYYYFINKEEIWFFYKDALSSQWWQDIEIIVSEGKKFPYTKEGIPATRIYSTATGTVWEVIW